MKGYKGFTKDMTCKNNMKYEVGKTYKEDGAVLCNKGLHFCERPIDVLGYYSPGIGSRYAEVDAEDISPETNSEDTKKVSKTLTVKAEIGIIGLAKAQIEYVKSHTTFEHTDEKQATAGEFGAATAGYRGAATAGDSGAATAGEFGSATAGEFGAATAGDSGAATAGEFGAATSRGMVSVGENGCGLVRGNDVKIKGGLGSVLTICEEKEDGYDIDRWKSFVVDGEKIKSDTFYKLKGNKLVLSDE